MINDNMMPLSSVCGFINPWNPMNEYVYRYIMLYSPKQPNWLSIFHIRDHRFLVNRWNVWCREWCRWKSPSTTRDMMSFTMKFGGFPRDFQTNPHGCNTPWSKIFDVFFFKQDTIYITNTDPGLISGSRSANSSCAQNLERNRTGNNNWNRGWSKIGFVAIAALRFQKWFFVSYFDLRPFVKAEVSVSGFVTNSRACRRWAENIRNWGDLKRDGIPWQRNQENEASNIFSSHDFSMFPWIII